MICPGEDIAHQIAVYGIGAENLEKARMFPPAPLVDNIVKKAQKERADAARHQHEGRRPHLFIERQKVLQQ